MNTRWVDKTPPRPFHPLAFGAAILVIIGLALIAFAPFAGANNPPAPTPNSVEYWCPNGGVKIDPASTPFTVPPPPEGRTWTLLVLKAGDENSTPTPNETFVNPTPGTAYSRTDLKSISHVILCQSTVTTTTTPTTQGDDPPTTTSTSTTIATTTTAASTTTACPDCTPGQQTVPTTVGTTTTQTPCLNCRADDTVRRPRPRQRRPRGYRGDNRVTGSRAAARHDGRVTGRVDFRLDAGRHAAGDRRQPLVARPVRRLPHRAGRPRLGVDAGRQEPNDRLGRRPRLRPTHACHCADWTAAGRRGPARAVRPATAGSTTHLACESPHELELDGRTVTDQDVWDGISDVVDKIPRDRYGRPIIPPAAGGKPKPYTRVTTLAETLDDRWTLERWKQRQVAIGLMLRRDLLNKVAAL